MADLNDFSGLVDLYYSKVFYHCVKLTKNNADSADITQNTFTKAFINIKNLKDINSFGAWLFTICNNEIKIFYKNRDENRYYFIDAEKIKANPGKTKKYDGLYYAVNLLDEKYRQLIILKYFAQFSSKDIAALTGFDDKLIKSRLYDARKKLKNIILNQESQKKSVGFTNIYNYNQERKREIMSALKLLELGSQVVPSMSLWGQKELLKCAENNEKFSSGVLSELAKIEKGSEFTLECEGKLSYDEFIKILTCCEDDILYRLNNQEFKTWRAGRNNKLLRDAANYIGLGVGYIEDLEFIMVVPSLVDTINWYKKYLGWHSDDTPESCGEWCHAIIRVANDYGNMSRSLKGFHLWQACDVNPATKKGHCFVFVTGIEDLREKIKATGWEKISDISKQGWGVNQLTVEDLNGFNLHFCEWYCD